MDSLLDGAIMKYRVPKNLHKGGCKISNRLQSLWRYTKFLGA